MNKEITFIEETIRVIRPTTLSHIFDEEKFDKIDVRDAEGNRTVILRLKEVKP